MEILLQTVLVDETCEEAAVTVNVSAELISEAFPVVTSRGHSTNQDRKKREERTGSRCQVFYTKFFTKQTKTESCKTIVSAQHTITATHQTLRCMFVKRIRACVCFKLLFPPLTSDPCPPAFLPVWMFSSSTCLHPSFFITPPSPSTSCMPL